jgi:hypothetical protein
MVKEISLGNPEGNLQPLGGTPPDSSQQKPPHPPDEKVSAAYKRMAPPPLDTSPLDMRHHSIVTDAEESDDEFDDFFTPKSTSSHASVFSDAEESDDEFDGFFTPRSSPVSRGFSEESSDLEPTIMPTLETVVELSQEIQDDIDALIASQQKEEKERAQAEGPTLTDSMFSYLSSFASGAKKAAFTALSYAKESSIYWTSKFLQTSLVAPTKEQQEEYDALVADLHKRKKGVILTAADSASSYVKEFVLSLAQENVSMSESSVAELNKALKNVVEKGSRVFFLRKDLTEIFVHAEKQVAKLQSRSKPMTYDIVNSLSAFAASENVVHEAVKGKDVTPEQRRYITLSLHQEANNGKPLPGFPDMKKVSLGKGVTLDEQIEKARSEYLNRQMKRLYTLLCPSKVREYTTYTFLGEKIFTDVINGILTDLLGKITDPQMLRVLILGAMKEDAHTYAPDSLSESNQKKVLSEGRRMLGELNAGGADAQSGAQGIFNAFTKKTELEKSADEKRSKQKINQAAEKGLKEKVVGTGKKSVFGRIKENVVKAYEWACGEIRKLLRLPEYKEEESAEEIPVKVPPSKTDELTSENVHNITGDLMGYLTEDAPWDVLGLQLLDSFVNNLAIACRGKTSASDAEFSSEEVLVVGECITGVAQDLYGAVKEASSPGVEDADTTQREVYEKLEMKGKKWEGRMKRYKKVYNAFTGIASKVAQRKINSAIKENPFESLLSGNLGLVAELLDYFTVMQRLANFIQEKGIRGGEETIAPEKFAELFFIEYLNETCGNDEPQREKMTAELAKLDDDELVKIFTHEITPMVDGYVAV